LTRGKHALGKRLTAGRIDLVPISGWGFVSTFLAFLDELQFFALLDLEGTGFRRVLIPIARLVMTYQEVLDLHDLRRLIETTGVPFGSREPKQGWYRESNPKETEAAVRGHVFLTLVTFPWPTPCGRRRAMTAQHGARRQRAEEGCGQVVSFAQDRYALFDSEEVLVLLGVVPKLCFRTNPTEVRHRYGLSSVA
jgi:hypothetical protein